MKRIAMVLCMIILLSISGCDKTRQNTKSVADVSKKMDEQQKQAEKEEQHAQANFICPICGGRDYSLFSNGTGAYKCNNCTVLFANPGKFMKNKK